MIIILGKFTVKKIIFFPFSTDKKTLKQNSNSEEYQVNIFYIKNTS